MNGFVEIDDGLWYEESTGLPWTTRTHGELERIVRTDGREGYYRVRVGGKQENWHRVVWRHFKGDIPHGKIVDHVNNIYADNRIVNLRLLNSRCGGISLFKSKNNASGYPGVHWDKRENRWRAAIKVRGKKKHLGYFNDIQEAADAYRQAKIIYHGEDYARFLS